MAAQERSNDCLAFAIDCASGRRYVVYHSSVLLDPSEHQPDRWYFRPYPPSFEAPVGRAFSDAEQARLAAVEFDSKPTAART